MFSADYSSGPLGEFFATEHPTWEEYGRSGEAFFGGEITGSQATPSGIETEIYPIPSFGGIPFLRYFGDYTPPPVTVGEGGAARASIAEQLRLEEAAKLAGGAIDYISDIPGEIGEAGGEFVAGLGAGVGTGVESVLTGVTAPITAIPGDLFEGIPTWVPLLGAAYLLTRQ